MLVKNFACAVKNIPLLFFKLFTTKRIYPEEMTEERVSTVADGPVRWNCAVDDYCDKLAVDRPNTVDSAD